MVKKIIGLVCGRKNGITEAMMRAAASGAAELGVETEIIRAMDLKVLPCRGCWACRELKRCVIKDDVDWILDRTCKDDCGLILSVPCYHLRSNGFMVCITDRLNHVFTDYPEILDKTRVGGIIGVGGSGYDGWASLNLPLANIFLQHTRVLVDQIQINHCALKEWNLWMQQGSLLTNNTHTARILDNDYETIWKLWKEEYSALDFKKMAYLRAKKLGRNVAEAMSKDIKKVKYVGEQSAVSCPVCHSNIVLIPEYLPYIMCPICSIRGTITVKDAEFKVEWNKKDAQHPRFTREGVKHHFEWLGQHREKGMRDEKKIAEFINNFSNFGKLINPPR